MQSQNQSTVRKVCNDEWSEYFCKQKRSCSDNIRLTVKNANIIGYRKALM